jgi:hypothetical protein
MMTCRMILNIRGLLLSTNPGSWDAGALHSDSYELNTPSRPIAFATPPARHAQSSAAAYTVTDTSFSMSCDIGVREDVLADKGEAAAGEEQELQIREDNVINVNVTRCRTREPS